MQDKIQIIEHEDKTIYFSDYTNADGDELVKNIAKHHQEQLDFIERTSEKILILTDVAGSAASREVMNCFKEKTKVVEKDIIKSAVIGVEGIQRLLLNGINKFSRLNTKAFTSKSEALDWLVE